MFGDSYKFSINSVLKGKGNHCSSDLISLFWCFIQVGFLACDG